MVSRKLYHQSNEWSVYKNTCIPHYGKMNYPASWLYRASSVVCKRLDNAALNKEVSDLFKLASVCVYNIEM